MNNIKNIFICGTMTLLFSLLNGCGGGGDGGPTATPVSLKFRTYSASTAPAALPLGESQFRILLPLGVSVATTAADPKLVAPGALALSGIFTQSPFKSYTAGKFLQGSYSSAKPAGSGRDAIRVNMSLNPPNTFTVGEFLTVNCSAAPGSATAKGNFTLSEVILGGAGGADLTTQYKLDFKVQ
jgi:hypothetical protein